MKHRCQRAVLLYFSLLLSVGWTREDGKSPVAPLPLSGDHKLWASCMKKTINSFLQKDPNLCSCLFVSPDPPRGMV